MTAEVNQSVPDKRPRFVYFGLIASLAVNLLFVGLFVTAAWHLHQEEEKPKSPGLLGFVHELSPDRRAPVEQEIAAARDSMKDLRSSVRQSWLDANALLTAEPFDKAKFTAGLMQLRDVEARYRTSIYNMVAETASVLTPEERKLFQKWRAERRAKFLNPNDDDKPQGKDDGKALTD
ncbi:MAG: periplasmic heavy metal sensor [Hyphomicrobium sp.]